MPFTSGSCSITEVIEQLYLLLFPLLLVLACAASIGCASTPDNSGTPAWVDNVNSVYNRSQFVAAVGYHADREMAEKNAIANLAAFFGQSIQADQTIINAYHEAVRDGISTGWIDSISMNNVITTSASMDVLVGAEIREVWRDAENGIFYAAAVMEKAKTIQMYTEMISANLKMINGITGISPSEKNTLEGVARYQFAATIADANIVYANLLKLLDAAIPGGVKRGDEYRLEARNIIKTIPISVAVTNDREDRLKSAFTRVLTDVGFISGGNNPVYVLRVSTKLSPVDSPGNPIKYVQMELNANLLDSSAMTTLPPFSFTIREGHTTAAGAENRVFVLAERRIEEEFKKLLVDYLARSVRVAT